MYAYNKQLVYASLHQGRYTGKASSNQWSAGNGRSGPPADTGIATMDKLWDWVCLRWTVNWRCKLWWLLFLPWAGFLWVQAPWCNRDHWRCTSVSEAGSPSPPFYWSLYLLSSSSLAMAEQVWSSWARGVQVMRRKEGWWARTWSSPWQRWPLSLPLFIFDYSFIFHNFF